jgi:hypothetical protein
MTECTRTEGIVQAWEEQGVLSAADLAFVTGHLRTCGECARRNAPLLALFERDASVAGPDHAPEPELRTGFADSVMSRIGASVPRRVFPTAAWAAIAAACLVMAVGIGFAALRLKAPTASDQVVIRFELDAPGATSVSLVGSFSGWSTTKFPMRDPDGDGVWQVDVHLKRDSINTYNFVIDGKQWITDPRSQAKVDDGFGGESSVLRL